MRLIDYLLAPGGMASFSRLYPRLCECILLGRYVHVYGSSKLRSRPMETDRHASWLPTGQDVVAWRGNFFLPPGLIDNGIYSGYATCDVVRLLALGQSEVYPCPSLEAAVDRSVLT